MSDMTMPSWRVRPPEKARAGLGIPPRMALMIAGGLTASLFIAMGIWWGVSKIGPRGVPVVQPDERPWRVRPDDRGGLQVPNQGSEVFERGAAAARPAADARLAPGPEAPRLDALRAQSQPQAAPAPAQAAPPAAPGARPGQPATAAQPGVPQPGAPQAAAPQAAATTAQPANARPGQPAPAPAAQPAAPQRPTATNPRIQVQLAAARSEEAARAEWQRLAARVPELQGRTPAVTRLEREGQPTLFRLRTAGFQDAAAARQFCEALQARQASCIVIGAN